MDLHTNNYTFFYPASMVWRSTIKIGDSRLNTLRIERIPYVEREMVHYREGLLELDST